mmetsp:Transcript_2016/g.4205  ORF Transcript_2016/g.4205 Transcript_2016/m.4205 type:complete len:258 (+) Transcript_2016:85-858(+)
MIFGVFSNSFSPESTKYEKLWYAIFLLLVFVYGIIVIISPLTAPVCHIPLPDPPPAYQNHDYAIDMCRKVRYAILGGMTKWECDMCTRVLVSMACGSLVGWERRRADRPAGIRTMAMVCLGACVFTVDSMFAFLDGPMSWDASRVSAAIPSGVGFLGAASIWKGTTKEKDSAPEVHGLTTATSVWFSAAVGILVGGALYVPALFATLISIVYLRFAPRSGPALQDSSNHGLVIGQSTAELAVPLRPKPLEKQASLRM